MFSEYPAYHLCTSDFHLQELLKDAIAAQSLILYQQIVNVNSYHPKRLPLLAPDWISQNKNKQAQSFRVFHIQCKFPKCQCFTSNFCGSKKKHPGFLFKPSPSVSFRIALLGGDHETKEKTTTTEVNEEIPADLTRWSDQDVYTRRQRSTHAGAIILVLPYWISFTRGSVTSQKWDMQGGVQYLDNSVWGSWMFSIVVFFGFHCDSIGLAAARIDVRAFNWQIIPACQNEKQLWKQKLQEITSVTEQVL